MAEDVLLKLKDVKGDSRREGHKEEIELLSWSWGMSNPSSVHTSSGGGKAKVSVADLSFTANMSFAGATLAQFCANGKHIAEGKLTCIKADGNSAGHEFMTIELKDIIITQYSTGGSGQDPTEHFTIQFAEFTHKYIGQKADGGKGDNKQYTVNIPENKHS